VDSRERKLENGILKNTTWIRKDVDDGTYDHQFDNPGQIAISVVEAPENNQY